MGSINFLIKFIFIFLIASQAFAYTTGTVWIPNDLTEPSERLRFDSRVAFTLDKRGSDTTAQSPTVDEGVTYGIFDNLTVGAEGGLDWWEPESQDNLKCLHAHFKFSVHETASFPGIALGFYNFGFKANTTDENILYVGLAKDGAEIGRFFAGYSVGNSNVLVDEIGRAAHQALLLSWQHPAPLPMVSRNLSLMVDFQSSQSQEGALNFGAKWYLRPDFSVLLGYDIFNNRHLQRDTFNIQLYMRL